MFKQVIKYEDFDGNERNETFYFNLTKAELLELQATTPGGFGDYLQRIIDAGDTANVYSEFCKIVDMAYGEKSDDGRFFRKLSPAGNRLVEDFKASEAYSEFILSLIQSPDLAAKFVVGIMPKGIVEEMRSNGELPADVAEQLKAVKGGNA